jgi:non-heme chloroperoxidase
MNYLEIKNDNSSVKIHYNDYGQGKPVILVHGWPLSAEMWEYQLSNLIESGFRVITYDRRGFGKSSKPWNGYDYDTLTADLKALIDHLNLKDITLVGFSMGGGEVVRYFSKYGGANVTKAVLVAAVTPFLLQTSDHSEGVPQEVFDEIKNKIKQDRIGFLDDFGKAFFGVSQQNKALSEPLLQYFRMLGSLASPKATLDCVDSFSATDFRAEMASVKVPTLVIHGDKDQTVPIGPTGEAAAKAILGSKYLVYPGAPHGLFYTHKEKLNADLLKFISS